MAGVEEALDLVVAFLHRVDRGQLPVDRFRDRPPHRRQKLEVAGDRRDRPGGVREHLRDELVPLAADRSRVALAAYRAGGSLQPWIEARRDEINTRLDFADALAAWGRGWVALAYLIPAEETP